MRFKDLSQSAVQCLWNCWKDSIRELLDEFNEDVFNGRGRIRENKYQEYLHLLLETKVGCLYILPLPGRIFALRFFKQKLEKVDPALIAAMSKGEDENFIGGIQVEMDMAGGQQSLIVRSFRIGMGIALRRLYRDAWARLPD